MTHAKQTFAVLGLATAAVLTLSSAAAAQTATCPVNGTGLTGPVQCACPAGMASGTVWGSGIYTSDSHICNAAVHAGAIGTGGGQIMVTPGGRQEQYPGSTQYGVTSSSWGAWDSSFTISPVVMAMSTCATMPAGAELHECFCPDGVTTESVWGSGPYTNDSSICTAAIHAGVLSSRGGTVRVLAAPGLQSYRGSEWNGVSTMDYGPWSGSIVFDRN